MNEMESLYAEYFELLKQQLFDENDLDYSVFEKQKEMLQQMAMVGNSGLTVFDLHNKEHLFASYNFQSLFGYDFNEIEKVGTEYFNSKIHPEDLLVLLQNGIAVMKTLFEFPISDRKNFKVISEYRILDAEGNYIRVIEQQVVLEIDSKGNVWLALGILDISPNQEKYEGVKCQLLNYRTGKLFPLVLNKKNVLAPNSQLTKRENEILLLVKDGFLSKEISDKLSISVHTVNTHRQRILEKFGVDNSHEAIKYASRLSLID